MRHARRPVSAASLFLLSLLAGLPRLGAATFVWDGGHPAKERLSDNQNWNPNSAPPNDGTADLIFTGAVRLNPTVDVDWSVNSITFSYLAGAFDLNGTSSLTIQGNAVASAIANDDADAQTISAPLVTARAQTWTANAGALTISGTVANDYALTLAGSANTTLSNTVSGTGSLTKTGSGTLFLSGANTYSGGTTISAGTVRGSTTSLQGNIVNDAALVFDQTTTGTYTGAVSGSGSVTKSGSGAVTFSGVNTYTGATTIATGTLRVSGGSALSDTGAVVLADVSGAVLDLNGSAETIGSLSGGGASGGDVTLGSGGVLTVGGANASTSFAGYISGAGSLVKTGSGTLVLSGSNSYSAGTTVSAGTLQGSAASLQGDIATASGAAVVFDQSSAGAYAGVVSGSGSLAKTGSGTLTLSGANSYSGATTVSAGTLRVSGGSALSDTGGVVLADVSGAVLDLNGSAETIGSLSGGGASGGDVTLGSGGVLTVGGANASTSFAGSISGAGSLVKTGSGTLVLSGSNSYSAGTTVSAGTLQGSAASLQGDIATASGSVLVFDQASAGAYAGVVSGSGSLTKTGAGTLTLSGANSYSGATTVSAGALALGASDALSAASALTLGSGTTLALGGAHSARVGALGFADATLDFGAAGVANAFLFADDGAFSGTLTVLNWEAGSDVLAFASGASVADAFIESVYFSGVGSGVRGATGVSVSGYSGAWDTIVAAAATFATWDGGGANNNLATAANWSGDATPASGTSTKIAFAGSTRTAPVLTADFTVNSLKFESGAGSFTLSTNSGKTLALDGPVPSIIQASASAQTVAVPVSLAKNTFVEIGGAGNLVVSGAVSGAGGLTVLGSGAGEVVLSGANSYTGATSVNAGTVVLQNGAALGDVSAGTSVASGATLRLENNISVGAEALALSGTLRQASGVNSYGGAISGVGDVVIDGGQLTLSGSAANSYSGSTTVNAGTLVLGKSAGLTAVAGDIAIGDGSGTDTLTLAAAHQIADSSRVTLSSGGAPVFDLANNHETIGSLSSSNSSASVTLGSATLSTGADNSSTTFAGVVSGSGGLAKLGSGTFTLSGANTYTGSTSVNAGTLALGASDRISDSSTLALAGGAFSLAGLYSERVGGLSYTDGSVVDFGAAGTANRLLFGADAASSGTLTLRNWTSGADTFGVATNAVGQSFLDNIYFDGLGVGIGAEIGSLVSVPGYGAFYEIRPIATFSWTGGNSGGPSPRNAWNRGDNWSGAIAPGVGADKALVFGGTLDLANDMNGAFIVRSIRYDASAGAFVTTSSTGDTLTVRGGGVYNDSTATQTLDVPVSVGASQTWTAANGALSVTGAGVLLGANTLTVTGAANTTVSSLISGTGSAALVKNGAGTLTLSGANTYAGSVVVNAGTLAVSHASALGATTAGTTVNSGGTLALSGGIAVGAEALSLAGAGASSGGALRNVSGNNSYAGAITLSADATIASDAGTLTLSGGIDLATYAATFAGAGDIAVSGTVTNTAGDVAKNGSGTLTFSGANTYIGVTSVNAGTLVAAHSSALGTTAGDTTVASGATLALAGGISVGAEALTLSGSGAGGVGALRNNSGANSYAGAITLAGATTITSASGTLSLTGTIAAGGNALAVDGAGDLTIASTISGATDLAKSGSGTLAFTADQSFSGELTLDGGTFSLVDTDVSVSTLRVTAASVLDFSGVSTLTVGQLVLEFGGGETLSITSWQDLSDFFYVSNFLGASYDLQGQPPTTSIVFASFSPDDTRWKSDGGEITPVPEPSAYGLLAFGGLVAWSTLRRRKAAR